MVAIKRAYDRPSPADGRRILVDRLWPRGLTRAKAAIDEWAKDLAPSDPLRRWFAHDPEKCRRYRRELREHGRLLRDLAREAARGRVTLVYAARDPVHNNAVVLKEVLERL
jgi:uncharacterized protein YeaO (DUF488 family)